MYMIVEVSQYVAVASFSEAWIEIVGIWFCCAIVHVASFSEAWIEIQKIRQPLRCLSRRLLLGGVD